MRIDFAARYKEVSNLLNAPSKPATTVTDEAFERDLGSLLLQPTENTEVKEAPVQTYLPPHPSRNPIDDIRASFRFKEAELEVPLMTPATPPEVASAEPKVESDAVKTPTVFEVKRVEVPSVVTTGIPQLDKQEIRTRLVSASQKLGLDPSLTQSVVSAESSFNTKAVSSDGHASKGLFQLLDSTGRYLMSRAENPATSYDPFNPELNIQLGTSYLRYLHDIFKTPTELPNNLQTWAAADDGSLERLAVAAFNAGEGRVASAQGRSERSGKDPAYYDQVAPFLPRSTREYVTRVIEGKKSF